MKNEMPGRSGSADGQLRHMPQLDGLRAFAVAAVMIHHFSPEGWDTGATWGVKLFFVLSGFLITSILIRSRNAVASTGGTVAGALRRFYARRCLRIFPLYYFVIAVGVILNLDYTREYLGWLLTYTLNIRMAEQGWFVDHFAHFWTLSIEEQFYFFWPWVVLLTPRKWLMPATLAMISMGPLYRLYHVIGWRFFESEATVLRTYIFTLTCFDTLGMGALLAVLSHGVYTRQKLRAYLAWAVLPAGVGGLVVLNLIRGYSAGRDFDLVLGDLFLALVFSWLIAAAATGFGGVLGTLLELQPLRYLGRISYGIYVYHPFMPTLLTFILVRFGWGSDIPVWTKFVLATGMTFAVSSLSWHLMENPINNLKRYFA